MGHVIARIPIVRGCTCQGHNSLQTIELIGHELAIADLQWIHINGLKIGFNSGTTLA